jgi:predicted Zn-dependent protease
MSQLASGVLIALCGLPSLLGSGMDIAHQINADVQLRAMSDELARSKNLQLNSLEKPYFLQYTISDSEDFIVNASLGGITSSRSVHLRQPTLQVRVGDYKFDNTNSVFSQSMRFGVMPVDDDYMAMRANLWLSTDVLYKSSVDQITRKRTALTELADPDKTPDFAPAKPVQCLQPAAQSKLDEEQLRRLVRNVSAVFTRHQDVTASQVRLRSISSTYRLINSEGTVVRIPQQLADFSILSSAYAPDGTHVWNHQFFTATMADQFPREKELLQAAQTTAAETDALAKSPLGENYNGPVLFEGEAAAEMMAQVLTDALRLPRKPVSPPGANIPEAQIIESVWASKRNSKVLPDWITLVDDPSKDRFGNVPLTGQYAVDDEGVPAERVTLVEKGVLKNFLLSREPVRTFNASNGHGRLPGRFGSETAVIGNLFVQTEGGVSDAQLRAKLQERVKAAGLQYGLIIRRMDFPSTANLKELESLGRQLQQNGVARTLNAPILVYKAYADGREELVRGLRFTEFSAKDLRDITAASDQSFVLNYVNNGSSFNLLDVGSDATTSSVICPSLLFDSVELTRAENEGSKLPIVPSPVLDPQ